MVARENGAPVSLANAFARPIRHEDLISASIRALADYQAQMQKVYGLYEGATLAVFHDRGGNEKALGDLDKYDRGSLENSIATIMERIPG